MKLRANYHFGHQETYSLIFFSSLVLFLANALAQGSIAFTYSDNFGLIFKMQPLYWLGYTMTIMLIFYQFKNFDAINTKYVFLTFSLLVLYLIGTPFLYEKLPRFEDTWTHSLLAQRIYEVGRLGTTGNVYEQYPGTLFFYGLLLNLLPSFHVMKFFPVLFYMVGIATVYVIFKGFINAKTAFLIVVLYMFFNWTAEDNHLSPQFLMLNLYFLFMLFTIKLFEGPERKKERLFIIFLLSTAFVFSHLFTPIFVISILASTFALCKSLRKLALPILLLIASLFLLHESYLTTTLRSFIEYMENFKDLLFSKPIYEIAASRLAGSEQLSRQMFLGSRVLILLISIVLGFLGIEKLNENYKITSRFVLAWAFSLIPFLIFMFAAFKGEFAERFALVSSLPLSVASAYFLVKSPRPNAQVFVLILLAILTPLYFMGKYGNEAFESESLEKLKVDCFAHLYSSDCDENFVIVDSPLDYDLDTLGIRHFSTSREEIMSARIYKGNEIDENIPGFIERIENERKLNRVYSTNEAWFYIG